MDEPVPAPVVGPANVAQPRRGAVDPRQRGAERTVAGERQLAGEQLEGDHAERVDVDGGGDLARGELLGRHVRRRAGEVGDADPDVALVAGQAEVDDHDPACGPVGVDQEHVVGLEIAVDDADVVRGGERGRQLADDGRDLGWRQRALTGQAIGQRLAVQPLHGDEPAVAIVDAEIEQSTDAGVGDPARQHQLAVEPIAGVDAVERHGLERDPLIEGAIVRLVDLAHPAPAEQGRDAVAIGDQLAGGVDLAGRARGAPSGTIRLAGGGGVVLPCALIAGAVALDRPGSASPESIRGRRVIVSKRSTAVRSGPAAVDRARGERADRVDAGTQRDQAERARPVGATQRAGGALDRAGGGSRSRASAGRSRHGTDTVHCRYGADDST